MSKGVPGLREAVSDLVRDWELETAVGDDCTVETRHVSDVSRGVWRERVEEKWEHWTELGSGSFGVVSLHRCASGPRAGQARAVKKIRIGSGLSRDEVDVLSRELSAIVKFSHEQYRDCFVRSFGWYCAQNSIFITMEYFPLGDLQSYLTSAFPESETRRITQQVLQGLSFMHRNNFAHRDLKPSNILVHHKGPNWWVKISDFGTSKQIGSTALRTITGTPQYLAPELQNIFAPSDLDIIEKQTYTLAVDMWSVGAMAFRMATGRLPFEQPATLYRYVLVGDPFPTGDGLASDCLGFIASLMSASPRNRPTAADALSNPWIKASGSAEAPAPAKVDVKAAAKALETNPSFMSQYSNQWTTMGGSTRTGSQYSNRWTTINDTTITRDDTPTVKPAPAPIPAPIPTPIPATASSSNTVRRSAAPFRRSAAPARQYRDQFERVHKIDDLESRPLALAFSPDGKWLAVSFLGEKTREHIALWSYDRQEGPRRSQIISLNSCPRDLIFDANSRQLTSNNLDGFGGSLITWQLDHQGKFQKHLQHSYLGKTGHRISNSDISSNGQLLFMTYLDEAAKTSQVTVWRMSQLSSSDGRFQELKTKKYNKYDFTKHFCSPDGRLYVEVSGADPKGPLYVWKMNENDRLAEFPGLWAGRKFQLPQKTIPAATKISPDNRWILMTHELDDDRTKTAIIEFRTDKLQGSFPFNTQQVESAAFSSDSKRIALGLQDGIITLWKLNSKDTFEYQQTLKGHTGAVIGVHFSADDGLLFSRSKDETIIIWGR